MNYLRQRVPQQRPLTSEVQSMSDKEDVARKAASTSSNVKSTSDASVRTSASGTYSTTAVPRVEPYQQLVLAILLVTVLLGSLTSLLTSGASVTSFRGRLPAAQRISFSTSRLPGPLGALDLSALNPNYFANKRNIFNVIFVKQAWAWTTAIWATHYMTGAWHYFKADSAAPSGLHRRKTASEALYRPVRRYAVATIYWLLFTTWFFGPSVSDRILVASGAQCVPASMGPSSMLSAGSHGVQDAAHARSANSQNAQMDPAQCYASRPDDAYDTSAVEDTVTAVKNMTGDDERAKGASSASKLSASEERRHSSNKAIWQGGHDISGHAFLLSLSSMLLITEVAPTLSAGIVSSPLTSSHIVRRLAAYAGLALVGLWWWMLLMTSLFFHTPQEKLSGLIAGFGAWWSSYKLAR